ncbi:MAG: hypothetical protein IT379_23690 [Deltaproteobacteria bacterium]|nr:hypothetical protein [Deltaproteobacteria bacterium]
MSDAMDEPVMCETFCGTAAEWECWTGDELWFACRGCAGIAGDIAEEQVSPLSAAAQHVMAAERIADAAQKIVDRIRAREPYADTAGDMLREAERIRDDLAKGTGT